MGRRGKRQLVRVEIAPGRYGLMYASDVKRLKGPQSDKQLFPGENKERSPDETLSEEDPVEDEPADRGDWEEEAAEAQAALSLLDQETADGIIGE